MVQLRATFWGQKPFAFSACGKTLHFFCHAKHRRREEVMRADNILPFAPNAGRAPSASLLRPVLCLFQSLRELETELTGEGGGKEEDQSWCQQLKRTSLAVAAGQVSAGGEAAATQRARARACVWGGSEQERESPPSAWQPSE